MTDNGAKDAPKPTTETVTQNATTSFSTGHLDIRSELLAYSLLSSESYSNYWLSAP